MYSDDVLKEKASPKVMMKKPTSSRSREDEKSRRKPRQSKRKNGGSPMTVEVVSAINAAEQEAAEMEAMQKRERLLIRAMIGGFLLLVLGLARQHNPDDHGLDELAGGDDYSLRGSNPSLEWQGDRPNLAQHLTMESEDIHTKSGSASPAEREELFGQYLDMADFDSDLDTISENNSQEDAEMEPLDEFSNEPPTENEASSTESEDSTIESESRSKDEEEEQMISSGEEEYPADQIDGRLETAEEGGN